MRRSVPVVLGLADDANGMRPATKLAGPAAVARPDLPFEDFENGYGKWQTTGTAFGDNDRLSALVASKIDADLLIMLTDIDALYDKNPQEYPDARPIPAVFEITEEIVRKTVVGGESQFQHRADSDLIALIDHHRLAHHTSYRKNSALRRVDDRPEAADAEHSEVRDGECTVLYVCQG